MVVVVVVLVVLVVVVVVAAAVSKGILFRAFSFGSKWYFEGGKGRNAR